jgi:hypothetical protein
MSPTCRDGALNDAQSSAAHDRESGVGSLLSCSRHRRPYGATTSREAAAKQARPRQHIAASLRVPLECHSLRVRYPVLYSKKLHYLEPPYGIEP